MIDKVIKTIQKNNLIEKGDKLVLAVSGGPDSMCMLDILQKYQKQQKFEDCQKNPEYLASFANLETCQKKPECLASKPFEIVVAHVNHMIREEADQDEQYVREYCEKNEIEFYTKSIDVQKIAHTNKIGTEEAGRLARYEFFDEILKKTKATKIAIAHNKNDKVETILMHTLRGSGLEGLKGIEVKRDNIIRPLIDCERAEIENYCEESKLNPKIDKTNFENIYNRNKVRNIVIPYIQKEFNPNIIKTMDRLSDIVAAEDEYMEKQMLKAYQQILIEEKQKNEEIIIDLKSFNSQETVIKARLIRYIIKRLFGSSASIEKIHIEDVIKLCHNNVGNKYLTPNKNVKILVKNHKVYFGKQ